MADKPKKKKVFLNNLSIYSYKFTNGGEVLNLSCNLEKMIEQLRKIPPDEKGYTKFHIGQRKSPDEKTKATHYWYYLEDDEPNTNYDFPKKTESQEGEPF